MLYKYLPSERIDILEKLKIRFSPLPSLNDPFESLPLIETSKEKNKLISSAFAELEEVWCSTDESLKNEENRKLLEKTKNDITRYANEQISSNAAGQGLMSLLSDNFGVLCLSRTKTNLLMWAHYAEEGRGIVIGLDDSHVFFREKDMEGNDTRPVPVAYSQKRRRVIIDEECFYEKLLCEKPIDWAYEEEERLFRFFLSKYGVIGKDVYNQDIVLSELPKETIKLVFLGYRSSDLTEHRAIEAVKTNKINCKIYRSCMCKSEYRLKFEEVKFK